MAGRRVLVTGVSTRLGTDIARRLVRDPGIEYVAGLDDRPPRARIEGLDMIDADIRNPVIGRLIPDAAPDTIVHNKIVRRPGPGMPPQAAHDVNVIGTLQLLAACERAPSVRAIVIRGSAGIYGSEPDAPQFFTEEASRLYPLRTRFQRDVGEIEALFETFSRRHPRIVCTMLRYQPAIGPSRETQITRLLDAAVVPTWLGFDPRIQVVHEHDAVEAVAAAVERPVRGAVNVAGPGTIGLTRMLRMAGRTTLPLPPPLYGPVTAAGGRAGLMRPTEDMARLLRYGRAVDTRRLVDEVGYRPRYSTEAAVEEHVRTQGGRRLVPSPRDLVPQP